MHQSAMENGRRFVEKYLNRDTRLEIIDVGSFDVNGTLRPLFESSEWSYTGLDLTGEPGNNVDLIITADGTLPYEDESFDVAVSSSCLEHDPVFWKTISEMIRVTRDEGLIYLNVPSRGPYHPHPLDCWRFEADAFRAISSEFEEFELLESYITPLDEWHDNVGIFRVRKAAGGGRYTHSSAYSEMVRQESEESAGVVLPMVFEHFVPGRVADLGCGNGAWLNVARALGAEDVLGLDSASTEESFVLEGSAFMPVDLSRPIPLNGGFDLVMSLESSGQLPAGRAGGFVSELTRLGDVVLFSSAVPCQGGVVHENQQWPEYWAGFFAEQGFVALDIIRPAIWDDERVEWWHRQNTLLFCRKDRAAELFPGVEPADNERLTRIHPEGCASVGERIMNLERSLEAEERLRKAVSSQLAAVQSMDKKSPGGSARPGAGKPAQEVLNEKRSSVDRMKAELEELRAVNFMLERKLKQEVESRGRKFDEFKTETEKKIARMRRNLDNERARNAHLVNSTSWRVTRPLRTAKDFFLDRLSRN